MSRMTERGEFIRSKMMDIALRDSINGKGQKYFNEVYAMISEVGRGSGNARTLRCTKHPAYKEALKIWQEVFQQRQKEYQERR